MSFNIQALHVLYQHNCLGLL